MHIELSTHGCLQAMNSPVGQESTTRGSLSPLSRFSRMSRLRQVWRRCGGCRPHGMRMVCVSVVS